MSDSAARSATGPWPQRVAAVAALSTGLIPVVILILVIVVEPGNSGCAPGDGMCQGVSGAVRFVGAFGALALAIAVLPFAWFGVDSWKVRLAVLGPTLAIECLGLALLLRAIALNPPP